MRKITKRSATVGAVVAVAVGAGATAWAAGWLVNGGGTATASTSTIKPMQANVTVTGNVYPGKSTTAVALVDNPNDFPVLLKGMVPGAITATKKTGGSNAECAATLSPSSVTVTLPATEPRIEAGADDQAVTLPITVSEDLDAKCAGSSIQLSFTFSGTSTV